MRLELSNEPLYLIEVRLDVLEVFGFGFKEIIEKNENRRKTRRIIKNFQLILSRLCYDLMSDL